jgi:hypothetical protein
MSNESDTRLSAFSKDIQRVAEDIEHLAGDLGQGSRMMRDEVVGAEILATKEITERIGILWEVAERLNGIGREQARLLFEDYVATCREFTKGVGNAPRSLNYPDIVLSHWLRRLEHVTDGARSVSDLVSKETNLVEDVVFGMWKPFFAVVSRDWGARA